jgi:hypothetical protein
MFNKFKSKFGYLVVYFSSNGVPNSQPSWTKFSKRSENVVFAILYFENLLRTSQICPGQVKILKVQETRRIKEKYGSNPGSGS